MIDQEYQAWFDEVILHKGVMRLPDGRTLTHEEWLRECEELRARGLGHRRPTDEQKAC